MLKDEIREILKYIKDGHNYYKLNETKDNYDAYVIREYDWRGVGIPINNQTLITENYNAKFERIKIQIEPILVEEEKIYVLELLTNEKYAYEQFALICLDFIEPGDNGINRKNICTNPQQWVDKWKQLLGNKSINEQAYSYLGELIILKYLLQKGINAKLTNNGSIDIETSDTKYEVKTTIMRYGSEIEVHSQYQLHETIGSNNIKLEFVRLEKSIGGVSLIKILNDLKELEYSDISLIEEKINSIDFENRSTEYNILETREFNVDDKFPKITNKSFKDGIPKNIVNIKYTIDLDGLDSIKLEV